MMGDEYGDQDQRDPVEVVLDGDDDREIVEWLSERVPHDVPANVAAGIRSSMAAELAGCRPASVVQAGPSEGDVSFVKRCRPSWGTATVALVVFCMGLNVVIAWRSDHRVAAVVGDQDRQTNSAAMIDREETTARKMSVAALFEFNVSLIQRELNHERYESSRASFRERRRSTRPAEEKTPEEIPDRSGAAVRPRSGLQRVPELASFVTA